MGSKLKTFSDFYRRDDLRVAGGKEEMGFFFNIRDFSNMRNSITPIRNDSILFHGIS